MRQLRTKMVNGAANVPTIFCILVYKGLVYVCRRWLWKIILWVNYGVMNVKRHLQRITAFKCLLWRNRSTILSSRLSAITNTVFVEISRDIYADSVFFTKLLKIWFELVSYYWPSVQLFWNIYTVTIVKNSQRERVNEFSI